MCRGKLFIIGIGPGQQDQMTLRAHEALNRSEIIVGYHVYIKLLGDLTDGKEIISTGLKKLMCSQLLSSATQQRW